jgi:hypothetical protein
MRRKGKTAGVSAGAAALLALLACREASAQAIDAPFKFEGDGVTGEDTSLNVAFLSLNGPITKNNIGLVLLATTRSISPTRFRSESAMSSRWVQIPSRAHSWTL